MAGDMSIKPSGAAPVAGGAEQRQRSLLAPGSGSAGVPGSRITVSESVTLSAQALSLAQGEATRSTSVVMNRTRQVELYAPPRPRPASPGDATTDVERLGDRLSAEEVAKNVLGFVAGRLEQEKAAGASEEKLRGLLDQAREGIERGYAEARQELEERDLLDAELEDRIGAGRERIEAGLDRLAARLSSSAREDAGEAEPRKATPRKISRDAARISDDEKPVERRDGPRRAPSSIAGTPRAAALDESLALGRASYAEASIGIEVMTRDGDRVTLYAFQSDASLTAGSFQRDGDQRMVAGEFGSFQAGGYRLAVEGELDEEEMLALEDLVGQVQGVARQFFDGDFVRAFDSALQLQSDPGEIAAFAVSLASRQVEQVSSRYGGGAATPRASLYEPLARQVSGVRGALESATPFADRAALVQQMIEALARQQDETSKELDQYLEFTRQIAARIEQNLSLT